MSIEHQTRQPQKTWLITGVSSGFGKALATTLLSAGHRVVGTVRNEAARQDFDQLKPGHSFGQLLDVTHSTAIPGVVADIETTIGAIDVLVNNAGYGHEGLIEESALDDFRHQFEVNVFGAVAMIKAVLPFMRERRSGHILNITSMGGLTTFPGLGLYHGSKFALEDFRQSTQGTPGTQRPASRRSAQGSPGHHAGRGLADASCPPVARSRRAAIRERKARDAAGGDSAMGNGFPENRFRLMAKHLFDDSDVTRRIPIRWRTETLD
jgi:NAD(P)-dependent dehydrogenase (short-subunit alcohol dehydrogenase family)